MIKFLVNIVLITALFNFTQNAHALVPKFKLLDGEYRYGASTRKLRIQKNIRGLDIYCQFSDGSEQYLNYLWIDVHDNGAAVVWFEVDKWGQNNSPAMLIKKARDIGRLIDAHVYSEELSLADVIRAFNGPLREESNTFEDGEVHFAIEKCW